MLEGEAGLAIELMLKLVLVRHKISWSELRQKHSLGMLYDKVPRDWKTKLEDSYSLCARMTEYKMVAFANPSDPSTFVNTNPPGESERKVMSLREFLVSLDDDFSMWNKRYSWEQITEDGDWRRYFMDIFPLVEFIEVREGSGGVRVAARRRAGGSWRSCGARYWNCAGRRTITAECTARR